VFVYEDVKRKSNNHQTMYLLSFFKVDLFEKFPIDPIFLFYFSTHTADYSKCLGEKNKKEKFIDFSNKFEKKRFVIGLTSVLAKHQNNGIFTLVNESTSF
jgi:hypothetical protein